MGTMRILIVGAYGYTGKLISKELAGNGIAFTIAGKNEEKLKSLQEEISSIEKSIVCDLTTEDALNEIIQAADLFINCAGPFTEESSAFVAKIAESGKTYLDITGELGFVKDSRELHHEKCLEMNALIIHGVAFESLLTDLVLQMIPPAISKEEINVYYQFNDNRVSPGTRITMKISKYRKSLHIKDGAWADIDVYKQFHDVKLNGEDYSGIPYPLPEIAFAHWNYKPKNVNCYMLAPRELALYVQPSTVNPDELESTLERLKTRKKAGPTFEQRATQRCQIIVKVEGSSWIVKTHNMYQLTAECIRLTVQELVTKRTLSGVLNPAQVFRGKEVETLKALNVSVKNESILELK
ncbi:MAG: short subunit dehydrogenase-like uncharacterized protein [Salibacteraceae bacterium]|jgi:short subunit dehydrogenase-like uncharacterized protein